MAGGLVKVQRKMVAVAVALALFTLLGGHAPASATDGTAHCKRDAVKIPVGTGAVATDVALLEGVNHVDVAYPECSDGLFNIDHESDAFIAEQHCAEGFLRVYASPNTFGNTVIINWLPSRSGSC